MAIIKEYKDGNTTIKIDDTYIKKDPVEIEKIFERIVAIGWEYFKSIKA